MSTEAMKLALKVLQGVWKGGFSYPPEQHVSKAITALDEALAQPQQEPVAKIEITRCKFTGELESWTFAERPRNAPAGTYYVYTTPQPAQRKPLTDEEMENILPDDDTPMSLGEAFVKFARAIEAAHGIKENT